MLCNMLPMEYITAPPTSALLYDKPMPLADKLCDAHILPTLVVVKVRYLAGVQVNVSFSGLSMYEIPWTFLNKIAMISSLFLIWNYFDV